MVCHVAKLSLLYIAATDIQQLLRILIIFLKKLRYFNTILFWILYSILSIYWPCRILNYVRWVIWVNHVINSIRRIEHALRLTIANTKIGNFDFRMVAIFVPISILLISCSVVRTNTQVFYIHTFRPNFFALTLICLHSINLIILFINNLLFFGHNKKKLKNN